MFALVRRVECWHGVRNSLFRPSEKEGTSRRGLASVGLQRGRRQLVFLLVSPCLLPSRVFMLRIPTSSGSACAFECNHSFINDFGLKGGVLVLQKWAVAVLAQYRTAGSSVLASLASSCMATLCPHLQPLSGHWKEELLQFFLYYPHLSPSLCIQPGGTWWRTGSSLLRECEERQTGLCAEGLVCVSC